MNYWSPLTCLVKKQEREGNQDNTNKHDLDMKSLAKIGPVVNVAANRAQKIANRRETKAGILDTGAMSGAAREEEKEALKETGNGIK